MKAVVNDASELFIELTVFGTLREKRRLIVSIRKVPICSSKLIRNL